MPLSPQDLLAAIERTPAIALLDPVVVPTPDERLLVLTPDEAELYSNALHTHADDGTYPAELARRTVEALERLGRLRVERLVIGEPPAGDLRAMAKTVRREIAAAVDRLASHEIIPAGLESGTVLELAQAYRELTTLAQAEELAENGRDHVERRALRVEGTVGHLLDVAANIPAEHFEGRLDVLVRPLEELARVTDHPSVRNQA